MSANLLTVPLRQCVPLDLGDELRQVIKRDYFQAPSSFETDLLLIGNLRTKVAKLSDNSINTDSIDLLKQYYGYLLQIGAKFPPDCIEFQWYSTFGYGPLGPTKSRSFIVEQINVLFQLGVVYSSLGLQQSRHTVEGLKLACNYFQLSCGCFEEILVLGKDVLAVPPDLTGDSILFLQQLMLAQAQECIWQNAIANSATSNKDSVIARLSIQVSNYYSSAYEYGRASDFIKLEWINHTAVKKYHFKAAANYRMSVVNLQAFQYGIQVAFLQLASRDCDAAAKSRKYVSEFVLEDLAGLTETIKHTLRVAERDNDLVYLKVVPGESELAPIKGTSMVKAILPEIAEKRIFNDLLPYLLIQVAQAYRERQDTFIQQSFVVPIESLNNMINRFLTDRNLPAAIDAILQAEDLPHSIIQHSQEIVGRGGTQFIKESIRELSALAIKCRELVDECQNRIDLDREEENMLHQRGSNRATTADAAGELIDKINKMNKYLNQAQTGDQLIANTYYEIEQYIQIYCGGYSALRQAIPDSKFIKLDDDTAALINDLRNAIDEITSLENSRKQFLHNIEIKSRNNNILPAIIEEYKRNKKTVYQNGSFDERAFESTYDEHMAMFNSELKFIEELKSKQINLEREIDGLNNRFVKETSQSHSASQSSRQERLQLMEVSFTEYLELVANISEGSKFYRDFLSRGSAVLKECENYLYNRRVEGRQIEAQFNQSYRESPVPTQPYSPSAQSGIWDPSKGIRFL